jgi:hypothetical protein
MTVLYPNVARWSTLVPGVWDPEWTNTDHVLSDQLPGTPGAGAVRMAAQALNLSLGDAAQLFANKGEAKALSATGLISGGGGAGSALTFVPGAIDAAASPSSSPPTANPGSYGGRIPIPPSVQTRVALLGGDAGRVSLLIQNNNASGGANLLVSLDGPIDTANPAFYLNLPPAQGIVLSTNAFVNPIYVAWGSGTVAGGVLMYGSAIATQSAGTRLQAPGSSEMSRGVAFLPYTSF